MKDARRRASTQELAALLEGEVTAFEAESLQRELADSPGARRRLAGLSRVRDALASPLAELENVDMVAQVRSAIDAGARPRARRPRWPWALAAVAGVAAVLGLVALRLDEEEFRPKSAASTQAAGLRWAGIQPYFLEQGGEPRHLVGALPRGAGLLFSYTNLGNQPYDFLMIFVVDRRGGVGWCHPAYESAGSDPRSLRIRRSVAQVPIAEVIQLDLAPGSATLHALFTNQPVRVSEVEAWLRTSAGAGATPWPNAAHQVLELEVAP